MTYEVLYDSPLATDLHILIHEATSLPIVINHQMITEHHTVKESNAMIGMMFPVPGEQSFKVDPPEAQSSDWIWETFNNGIRISGMVDVMHTPFEVDFWLQMGVIAS